MNTSHQASGIIALDSPKLGVNGIGSQKLDSLVLLRGVAVLLVFFCHTGNPLQSTAIFGSTFRFFHDYGKFGVQIFFVVSGFVIPLSLRAAGYTTNQYLKFLQKRIYRLHPPYLVALLLTLILGYLSYKAKGTIYPENATTILKSFFYLHAPAENPVFWTLTVEMEYYIFIGLAYWFFVSSDRITVAATLISLLISQTPIARHVLFFQYVAYFLIGIVCFRLHTERPKTWINYALLIFLFGFILTFDELAACLAASFATAFILYYKRTVSSTLAFFGDISYSLYLIHFPIGIKFVNLTARYVSVEKYGWLLFLVALLVITLLAWVFYRLIEQPAAILSSRVVYGHKARAKIPTDTKA